MEMKQWVEGVEAKIVAVGTDVATVKETLSQIEQKIARKPGSGHGMSEKSFGAQVGESEQFKSWHENRCQGSVKVELKAITSANAGTAWSDRDTDISGLPQRRLVVRDLLTVVPTAAGSVDWAKQTTRTNNASVVAETAQKPYSDYVWTPVNTPIRTIAHLAKLTRQALDDAEQLQGEVDYEMRYGLGLAEEAELLTGDGTGVHLTGLIPAATAYSAPAVLDDVTTMIDVIGLAVLQLALTEYPSDGIIMHPSDWMRIRLLKNADGEYLLGPPGQAVEPRLLGLPVVPTQAMTAKKFLVGGFKLQKLYDRMSPEVLIASENSDDFEKNMLTMRCEERLALAVRKPGALIYGDFDAALAAS